MKDVMTSCMKQCLIWFCVDATTTAFGVGSENPKIKPQTCVLYFFIRYRAAYMWFTSGLAIVRPHLTVTNWCHWAYPGNRIYQSTREERESTQWYQLGAVSYHSPSPNFVLHLGWSRNWNIAVRDWILLEACEGAQRTLGNPPPSFFLPCAHRAPRRLRSSVDAVPIWKGHRSVLEHCAFPAEICQTLEVFGVFMSYGHVTQKPHIELGLETACLVVWSLLPWCKPWSWSRRCSFDRQRSFQGWKPIDQKWPGVRTGRASWGLGVAQRHLEANSKLAVKRYLF